MKHLDPEKNALQNEIIHAKHGNGEAFESLLENYRPLISSLVKSTLNEFDFADSDYEDIYQEAVILFFHALEAYDVEQDDVTFGLYAKICIRNGLLTKAKKWNKRPPLAQESAEEEVQDSRSIENSLIEEERYHLLCDRIREGLTAYENSVWWLYLSGRTAKDVAAILNRDERSVQNAIYRIRRKLRDIIPHP